MEQKESDIEGYGMLRHQTKGQPSEWEYTNTVPLQTPQTSSVVCESEFKQKPNADRTDSEGAGLWDYLALLLNQLLFRLNTKLYSSLCPYAITMSSSSSITVWAHLFIRWRARLSLGLAKLCFSENLGERERKGHGCRRACH